MCSGQIPVAFAIAGLLDPVGIIVGIEAGFGEVARKVLLRESSAIGETNVVTVIEFVGTSHWKKKLSVSKRGRVQCQKRRWAQWTRHQTGKLTGCRQCYLTNVSVTAKKLVGDCGGMVCRVVPVIRQVEEEEEKVRSDASKAYYKGLQELDSYVARVTAPFGAVKLVLIQSVNNCRPRMF